MNPRAWRAGVLLAWLGWATAMAGEWAPPLAFPEMEGQPERELLVVGTLAPGGTLPPFQACSEPQRICLDPPPFWLKVQVSTQVAGPTAPVRFAAATTSHYGMPKASALSGRYLMALWNAGDDYVLQRYAYQRVHADAGQDYLAWYGHAPNWLPCGIGTLAVDRPAMTRRGEGARPAYAVQAPERDLFEWHGERAVPRRWISVAALADYLAKLPAGAARSCMPPAPTTMR